MARKASTKITKIARSETAQQALQHLEQVAAQHGLVAADYGDLVQRIGCSSYWGPREQHLRGYELPGGASLSVHVWHNVDHTAATIDVTAPAATMRTLLTIWAQRAIPADVARDELWLQRWAREQERVGARSRGRAPQMFVCGTAAREGRMAPNPYCDYGLDDVTAACAAIAWESIADLESHAWHVATELEEQEDAKDDRDKDKCVWSADDLMEMYWHATRLAERAAIREIMAPMWDAWVAYLASDKLIADDYARQPDAYLHDTVEQEGWLDTLRIWYDRRAREEEQQARHDWHMLDSCTIANAEHQRIPAQEIVRAYSAHSDRMVSITITCERDADAERDALDLARTMLQAMLPAATKDTQLTQGTQGTQGTQLTLC